MNRQFLLAGLMLLSLNSYAQTAPQPVAPAPAKPAAAPAKPTDQPAARSVAKPAAKPATKPVTKPAPVNKTWAPERTWGVELGVASDMFSYKLGSGDILNLAGIGYSAGGYFGIAVLDKSMVRFQGRYVRFNSSKDINLCGGDKCEFKMDYLAIGVGLETAWLEGSFPLSTLIAGGYAAKLSGTNSVSSARGDSGFATVGLLSPFELDAQTQIPVGLSADIYSYSQTTHLYSFNLTVGYTKSF